MIIKTPQEFMNLRQLRREGNMATSTTRVIRYSERAMKSGIDGGKLHNVNKINGNNEPRTVV